MIKRVATKIGDIFSARIDDRTKRYFQLVASDVTQLNSDVIRAFKEGYPADANPVLSEVLKGEVEFYAHCVTKLGVKMGCWELVGRSNEVGEFESVLFRDTEDYGRKQEDGDIAFSGQWYVWRIGGPFVDVGKLEGENRNAYIGLVINPFGIIELLKGNKYPPHYPDFE